MATILVADDKGSNRQFLATLFGYFGHRILEAEDGAEALKLVIAQRPDLVFTDVLMPVMDGLELARRIRGTPSVATMPIIFYTATYRGAGFRKIAAEAGVKRVIAKPSEPQAILNAVAEALGSAANVLSDDPAVRFKAAPQNRLTEEFIASIEDLGATVLRLNATIELGIDLMREREPARLVETFCRGAQDIIGAQYAACGMIGDDGLDYVHTCGLPPEMAGVLRDAAREGSLFEWMRTTRTPDRRRSSKGDLRRVGLPSKHPPVDSFLGIPIHGSDGAPGWLYLANKFQGEAFTDEDERLASTLAWQAAVAYQNTQFHNSTHLTSLELERRAEALSAEIAERERAEREREKLERQLRHAQKMEAVGTLAGGMAHDINNCLVPIISMTELALDTLPPDGPQREYLDLVKEAGTRIRDLVRRILIFSRHEEVEITSIDLTALCGETVKLLRATLPSTIDLRSQIKPRRAVIEGEAGQIQQTLLNLGVNAADAIGEAAGVIELSLDVVRLEEPVDCVDGAVAPGEYFALRVADTGSGMEADTISRIFEPFFTTKPPGKGTGLGLSMVHTIVQAHAGKLRVTSELGKGTAFEIYLPTRSR